MVRSSTAVMVAWCVCVTSVYAPASLGQMGDLYSVPASVSCLAGCTPAPDQPFEKQYTLCKVTLCSNGSIHNQDPEKACIHTINKDADNNLLWAALQQDCLNAKLQ